MGASRITTASRSANTANTAGQLTGLWRYCSDAVFTSSSIVVMHPGRTDMPTKRLQDAELTLRSGESHLGGFAKIDEVLEFIRSYL